MPVAISTEIQNSNGAMSQHGAALQTYNQELVKWLEEIKARRNELQTQIDLQKEEKNNLQREIDKLAHELTRVSESLDKKISIRNEYDKTIADTEASYVKILESSQILLSMLKKEATTLDQTLNKASTVKDSSQ